MKVLEMEISPLQEELQRHTTEIATLASQVEETRGELQEKEALLARVQQQNDTSSQDWQSKHQDLQEEFSQVSLNFIEL